MLENLKWLWSKDCGQYPQGSAAWGWFGFRMRVKCTVCIILRLEGRDAYNHTNQCVPVAIGPLQVGYGPDGPSANWSELGVDARWWCWRYYEYGNGI